MAAEKRRITKHEAATTQIDTAIKLYFENRDMISAYTLASAGNGIVEGIYQNKRGEILQKQREELDDADKFRFSWGEEWEIRFKPEHQKEAFRKLNAAQNFFKHADQDHDAVLEFGDERDAGLQLFMVITNYRLIFRDVSAAMGTFLTWYLIMNPDLMGEGNPLIEYCDKNPDLLESIKRLPHANVVTIGYKNLERSAPELFPPTDIKDVINAQSSRPLKVRVPSVND